MENSLSGMKQIVNSFNQAVKIQDTDQIAKKGDIDPAVAKSVSVIKAAAKQQVLSKMGDYVSFVSALTEYKQPDSWGSVAATVSGVSSDLDATLNSIKGSGTNVTFNNFSMSQLARMASKFQDTLEANKNELGSQYASMKEESDNARELIAYIQAGMKNKNNMDLNSMLSNLEDYGKNTPLMKALSKIGNTPKEKFIGALTSLKGWLNKLNIVSKDSLIKGGSGNVIGSMYDLFSGADNKFDQKIKGMTVALTGASQLQESVNFVQDHIASFEKLKAVDPAEGKKWADAINKGQTYTPAAPKKDDVSQYENLSSRVVVINKSDVTALNKSLQDLNAQLKDKSSDKWGSIGNNPVFKDNISFIETNIKNNMQGGSLVISRSSLKSIEERLADMTGEGNSIIQGLSSKIQQNATDASVANSMYGNYLDKLFQAIKGIASSSVVS